MRVACRSAGLLALALLTASVACTTDRTSGQDTVDVIGSDTMLVLNRRLAEGFMRDEPTIAVRVAGGGSGAGVEALIAGSADIAAVSRPVLPSEVQELHKSYGTLGVRYLIARDGLSVFVHPSNPVRVLSTQDLRRLFGGEVRSWKELGGVDAPVSVIVRPPNSGSSRFFRDHVLAGSLFAPSAVVATTTREVVAAVASDAGAVGFGGVAYQTDSVSVCSLDGISPDPESIRDERYPLARYLQFVTVAPATGVVRRFVEFCLGSTGQRLVEECGYLPLWSGNQTPTSPGETTAPSRSRN